MDFDFTTETITPDSTSILTIGGTGALELPSGTTGEQPITGLAAGAIRWNTTVPRVEYYSGSAWTTFGGGSVTSVSVVSANGLAGTVATSSTTPAITLSTTITGVLVGDGTAISAATGSTSFPGYAAGIASGVAGAIPYQTAVNTTGFSAAGTAGYVLVSGGTGSPTWTNAPTLTGTNFTGIPNGALTNSSITITGGTGLGVSGSPVSLGGTVTLSNTGVTSNVAGTGISVSGATGAVTITNTGVTSITGTAGNITASGATGSMTLNLATAGTPVTASFVKITTDTFGRVTATTPVVTGDITALVDATYVNVSGDTMTGALILNADPSVALGAATKQYVDAAIAGLSWKQSVAVATLVAGTLATSFAAGQVVDTVTLTAGMRILIKNQSTQTENGIYIVQASGAPVRSTDADTGVELVNASVYVDGGSQTDTGWVQTTSSPITIGSSNIVWAQFSGSGSYTAGTGLSLTGNTFANTGVLSNVAGTGISVSGATGNVTITNTGVTSAVGTAGNITVSAATGAVTYNLATAGTAGTYGVVTTDTFGRVTSGTVIAGIANGGTGLGTLGTANQVLGVNAAGTALEYKTVTAGTAISVVNAAGSITINNTGVTSAVAGTGISVSGATGAVTFTNTGVTTFSAGTTGLTPNTATTGAVTLAGILALANGGSNANLTAVDGGVVYSGASAMAITAAGTSGQYLKSNGAAAPTWVTLTNGGLQLYAENASSPVAPSATGTNAIALGSASSASLFGALVHANGSFATAGDAQEVSAVLRNLTSNNTATELFLDGVTGTQRMVLPNNSVWTYTIRVSARRTDATGSVGSWIFNGMIYRNASAATTTIPGGATSKTTLARVGSISGANDPVITADTTNGSLKVTVTGVTAQTYRWVATVQLSQVTN